MNEGDEDFELDQLAAEYKKKGGRIVGDEAVNKRRRSDAKDNYSDDSDDSDYDVEESLATKPDKAEKKSKKAEKDGFEIVPAGMS